MTREGNGQAHPYQVVLSASLKAALLQLHLQFVQAGKGNQFLAALRYVYERLRTQPREFGDPLYRLPALHLRVYQATRSPLVVVYAIHEEKPLVIIRDVKAFS